MSLLKRFHLAYFLVGLALAVVVFAASVWLFPDWAKTGAQLTALAVGGVVSLIANWRMAFGKDAAGSPSVTMAASGGYTAQASGQSSAAVSVSNVTNVYQGLQPPAVDETALAAAQAKLAAMPLD